MRKKRYGTQFLAPGNLQQPPLLTVYETFRNFAAEGMQVPQSAAAAAPAKLAYLFPPPGDIMFQGNFDALRRQAEEEEKY